jgi:hypothetical protein
MTDETIMELRNKFNIIGLPTFIVFNPRKNKVVKKWGGELYNTKKEAFIEELRKVA